MFEKSHTNTSGYIFKGPGKFFLKISFRDNVTCDYFHTLGIKLTTHVTGNVPGGLGCHDWDGVASQVITFLLGFFIGKFIQTLDSGKEIS